MMRRSLLLVLSAMLVAACAGPLLANAPAPTGAPFEKPTPRPSAIDPIPVSLPADDAPHDQLTEWWYVTGHLATLDGTRAFGYEAVIFRAQRGDFPVSWASHVALTEKPSPGRSGSFHYFERSEIGPQVDITSLLFSRVATAFAIVLARGRNDTSERHRDTVSQLSVRGDSHRTATVLRTGEAHGRACRRDIPWHVMAGVLQQDQEDSEDSGTTGGVCVDSAIVVDRSTWQRSATVRQSARQAVEEGNRRPSIHGHSPQAQLERGFGT